MKKNYSIIAATLLTLAIVVFLVYDLHRSNEAVIIDQFNQHQIVHVHAIRTGIETAVQTRAQGIRALSNFAALQYFEQPLMKQTIEEYFFYLKAKAVESVTVFDSTGTIVSSTNPEIIGTNHIQSDFWPWIRKRKNKGKVFLSTQSETDEPLAQMILQSVDELKKSSSYEHKDTTAKQFRFHLVTPIYQDLKDEKHPNPSKKFIGAFSLTLNFEKMLEQNLFALGLGKVRVWMMDTSGTLLYLPEHPEMMFNNIYQQEKSCGNCHISFDYVERMVKEKTGAAISQIKNKPKRLFAFTSLNFENIS